jgi:hypothetical protein
MIFAEMIICDLADRAWCKKNALRRTQGAVGRKLEERNPSVAGGAVLKVAAFTDIFAAASDLADRSAVRNTPFYHYGYLRVSLRKATGAVLLATVFPVL